MTKFNLSFKEFPIKDIDLDKEEYNVKVEETYKDEDVKNCLIFNIIAEDEEIGTDNILQKESDGFNLEKIQIIKMN